MRGFYSNYSYCLNLFFINEILAKNWHQKATLVTSLLERKSVSAREIIMVDGAETAALFSGYPEITTRQLSWSKSAEKRQQQRKAVDVLFQKRRPGEGNP